MSGELSVLFIDDSTTANKKMRIEKRRKKASENEVGGKQKVY